MTGHIAFVGEAWGHDEQSLKHAFVGPSGRELIRMGVQAGLLPKPPTPIWTEYGARDYWLSQSNVSVHNCFNFQPRPTNDIVNLCGSRYEGIPGREPIAAGKYIRHEYAVELERLSEELASARPTLIIACGGTPTWFFTGSSRISKIRGAIAQSQFGKFLPTYHPAAVLREWSLRPVTVFDLMKAAREREFPEVRRPRREIWIDPTTEDLEIFYDRYLAAATILAVDIETRGDQITCIGFAPSPDVGIVVPFTDDRKRDGSFWESPLDEQYAWAYVRRVLEGPAVKVAQNGLYDYHFLWRRYGIAVANAGEDTMLLHHALQPESSKGLDFLGSVYTNEMSWKLMTKFNKTIKKGS